MTMPDTTGCCRPRGPGQLCVKEAGFDRFEIGVLEIMRLYFTTFGAPHSQAWMRAMDVAFLHFPKDTAAMTSLQVLCAVQMMRRSRRSVFDFSSPTCPICAAVLTNAERHLMATLQCIRAGRVGEAETHAMLLCEGNDTKDFLAAVRVLASCAQSLALQTAE